MDNNLKGIMPPPIGAIIMGSWENEEYIPCDGRKLLASDYPDFAEFVKKTFRAESGFYIKEDDKEYIVVPQMLNSEGVPDFSIKVKDIIKDMPVCQNCKYFREVIKEIDVIPTYCCIYHKDTIRETLRSNSCVNFTER